MKINDLYRFVRRTYVPRQLLRVMKLTIFIIASFLMQISAATRAQTITLNEKNISLEKLIKKIRLQTGYDFLGDTKLIRKADPITIHVKEVSLGTVLKLCFNNQPLTFSLEDKTVVIRELIPEAGPVQTKRLLTGKVIDKDGGGIPSATVKFKGKPGGTFTLNDGTYKLNVEEDDILIFSFIGFKTKELAVKGHPVLNVKLEDDQQMMKDVVISGYFQKKLNTYTGAATVITKAQIQKYASSNIFNIIQNIDAGFKIQENNIIGSDPNKLPDITIRGRGSFLNSSTAPIFIMDGFETTMQKVFDMDLTRIESITLLKDASATILYGSRAANGVVLIETVAPKPGKLRVSYNLQSTVSIADLTEYHLMDASQKLEFERLAGLYKYSSSDLNPDNYLRGQRNLDAIYNQKYKQVTQGINTDWIAQPIRNSFSQRHSVYIDGGNEVIRYGVDANYQNEQGVMKSSGRDRYGVGFNLIYRMQDKLTIKNYASYNAYKARVSPFGSFSQYASLNPYESPFDDEHKYKPTYSLNDPFNSNAVQANPLYDAYLPNRNSNDNQTFTEQLNLDWFLNKSLRITGGFQLQKDISSSDVYKSPRSIDFAKDSIQNKGLLALTNGKGLNYTGNTTIAYNKSFNKHTILVGVGGEIAQKSLSAYGFNVTGFADDRFATPAYAIQFQKNTKPSSSESTVRTVSVFSNLSYVYDNRYFADFSFREDGSSLFGANNRFAPFYSYGAGWNIHNEKFWKKNTIVNQFRLRTSYGITGNQEFSAYQALSTYRYLTDRFYNNGIAATLMGYGNEDLKWQRQTMLNLGADVAMFNNRVRISGNYYIRKTDGLLTDVTVAPSLGFAGNSYKENLGEIQNKGVELNVNAIAFRNKDWEWAVSMQATHNKSKLLEISKSLKNTNDKNNLQKTVPGAVYEEGQSMSALKAVRSLGIDPANGKELYMTKDGRYTYTWNPDDKVTAGDTEPVVFGNIATNIAYKNWNLQATIQYRLGGDIYNQTLVSRVEGIDPHLNADVRALDQRWKQPGDLSFYKDIADRSTSFISSRFIQRENTFNLSSLSISYTKNDGFIKRLGLQNARLSFFMNDVFRISTIKQERGLDYPFARNFIVGLNVEF